MGGESGASELAGGAQLSRSRRYAALIHLSYSIRYSLLNSSYGAVKFGMISIATIVTLKVSKYKIRFEFIHIALKGHSRRIPCIFSVWAQKTRRLEK